ncbi:SWIM zinc finger family protein, partial [Alkalihalophilus pseudofirmus]
TNKVTFEQYGPDGCQATVIGEERFHVTVEAGAAGDIHTECTCPKLASFHKDCQHIAAVLIAIYEHERQGITPEVTNHKLTQGL